MDTVYSKMNSIPDVFFIAGTRRVLTVSVYTDSDGNYNCTSGTPYDLTGKTVTWVLGRYGDQGTNVLTKSATVSSNTLTVTLASADTANLSSGKYIQQPIIAIDGSNNVRPGQGVVTILAATPTS